MSDADRVTRAVRAHDEAVARGGLVIWLGSEPTFTDPRSEHPAWLYAALGADKEERAGRLLADLAAPRRAAAVLRTVGRQYGGEPLPRWSVGLYERRDGQPVWPGPPDPLRAPTAPACDAAQLERFAAALPAALAARRWSCARLRGGDCIDTRLVFRRDGAAPELDSGRRPELLRGPLHLQPAGHDGSADALAATGCSLLVLRVVAGEAEAPAHAEVELPGVDDVDDFLALLAVLSATARAVGLPALVLRGFPPPVDARIAWTTVTPDPAVIEVNHAPAPTASQFLADTRRLHDAAHGRGLRPYRLQYDGVVADSGGGGHLTLGGPAPRDSPFFRVPQLLPRLLRYLNNHPSLSYWFAPPHLGSSGQSPRPDEGSAESFAELDLALEQLDRGRAADPETLTMTLAPFLADQAGNRHRSELNIEKLWNPALGARGCQGLVELRAFRMARSPAQAAAFACLLRAIVAMLARSDRTPQLRHWGAELHDRFALPFHLLRDLHDVTDDLDNAGLGLDASLLDELFDDRHRRLAALDFGGCAVEVAQALEFHLLVGDVASQESGDSRLIDPSTARLQLTVRPHDGDAAALADWTLGAGGCRLPRRLEHDERGPLLVAAVRYRSFLPARGLHPRLPARQRVPLLLVPPGGGRGLELLVHGWRPDGAAYPGLPEDVDDAAARRRERVVAHQTPARHASDLRPPPPGAVSPYCLDLRRVP